MMDFQQSAKPKKTRRTSLAAQQARVNALANKKVASVACKMASPLWNVEARKKENGELDFLSIDQVREQVLREYGQAPCISTIYKDLQEGRIGESPKKRLGRNSKISDSDWSNVCVGISFVLFAYFQFCNGYIHGYIFSFTQPIRAAMLSLYFSFTFAFRGASSTCWYPD
jgi:hypothetical protein